jgi:hypothetical protein
MLLLVQHVLKLQIIAHHVLQTWCFTNLVAQINVFQEHLTIMAFARFVIQLVCNVLDLQQTTVLHVKHHHQCFISIKDLA